MRKMFDSPDRPLVDLLVDVRKGTIQLPDFQRPFVWDDEHIKSLLASVSASYPIGALMMLQAGSNDVRFKPRLIEGVELGNPPSPALLVLDGQQRLTALFQALLSGRPVVTEDARHKPIRRWYYVDVEKALGPRADREDSILSIPEDRKLRNFRSEVTADYSCRALECAAGLFPLELVFNDAERNAWQTEYLRIEPDRILARLDRWNEFYESVILRFREYLVPVIELHSDTPKAAVCQVFEKVNQGGVKLSVFELLTATYAADDYLLRADWETRSKRLRKTPPLAAVQDTDFLQAVTLAATNARRTTALLKGVPQQAVPGVSCKRETILELSLDEYKQWADPVTWGFEQAGKFLLSQKVFAARDVPYQTQIVPLAAAMAVLGRQAENDGVLRMLAKWYWSGVFGELYGSAVESRFARDVPEIVSWIAGAKEPSTVSEANFRASRLYSLRTRSSAAYKGLHALLLRDGARDFRTGATIDTELYTEERIDVHHIFPQDWCKGAHLEPGKYDSIINKAPLSARTNRMIGKNPPSIYLARIQDAAKIDPNRMDEILRSQAIDPCALRKDDFEGFFQARQRELVKRIEQVMGKAVTQDVPAQTDIEAEESEIVLVEEQ